jgi:hypothetical protein
MFGLCLPRSLPNSATAPNTRVAETLKYCFLTTQPIYYIAVIGCCLKEKKHQIVRMYVYLWRSVHVCTARSKFVFEDRHGRSERQPHWPTLQSTSCKATSWTAGVTWAARNPAGNPVHITEYQSLSGWGTALQTERSRVQFPIISLEFFIDLLWGRLSLWQISVPGVFPGGKGGRCIGLASLSPTCADCLKIWET